MKSNFWNGKKVFLTGHTGFKGSWLSLWLQSLGAELTGYALPIISDSTLFQLANVQSGMNSIYGDVRDFNKLSEALKNSNAEIVIHFAAQALVRYSYDNPRETYETNVMGTVNLLDAVKNIDKIKVVLVITTDKCYENKEWIWGYRENDRLGGSDPYSSSKACAELVTDAFRNSFFKDGKSQISISTARAGNVIGGGDFSNDRLLPDLVSSYFSNSVAKIRNPYSIRPWQHVLEPLSGYMKLIENQYMNGKKFDGAWNFGPKYEDCINVKLMVKYFSDELESGLNWEIATSTQQKETTVLRLDSTKSMNSLGWYSRMQIKDALKITAEWYKAHNNRIPMREYTLNQIDSYENF